jgi:DNA-binding transcriptional regulator/RsmH inhibitor MraZ
VLFRSFEIWSAADWDRQIGAAMEIPALLDEAMRKGEIPDELRDFSL